MTAVGTAKSLVSSCAREDACPKASRGSAAGIPTQRSRKAGVSSLCGNGSSAMDGIPSKISGARAVPARRSKTARSWVTTSSGWGGSMRSQSSTVNVGCGKGGWSTAYVQHEDRRPDRSQTVSSAEFFAATGPAPGPEADSQCFLTPLIRAVYAPRGIPSETLSKIINGHARPLLTSPSITRRGRPAASAYEYSSWTRRAGLSSRRRRLRAP